MPRRGSGEDAGERPAETPGQRRERLRRQQLANITPHQVKPGQVLNPTGKNGREGRAALTAALDGFLTKPLPWAMLEALPLPEPVREALGPDPTGAQVLALVTGWNAMRDLESRVSLGDRRELVSRFGPAANVRVHQERSAEEAQARLHDALLELTDTEIQRLTRMAERAHERGGS